MKVAATVVAGLVVFLAVEQRTGAQNPPFSSGSSGKELALNITASGITYFDPVAMNLNPVVPGVFHFTTINVAAGSTLKFSERKYHGPVYFLASGDVTIAGTLDLSGENSYGSLAFTSQRVPNAGGSGGFSGGMGGYSGNPALPGNGPGGGAAGVAGPGSESVYGAGGTNTSNQFLVPLIGGSGGGGTYSNGSIGASGAGAILIASSTSIVVTGLINARGGEAGSGGGAGGGGAVRLVANSITGGGTVQVVGGSGGIAKANGGPGMARFESNNQGGLNVTGPTTRSVPYLLNLPATGPPTIIVTSINGQTINANPFSFPDATISSSTPVPIVIQAQNVPVGTIAKVYVFSEAGPDQVINIGPLTGTLASSTATANITYPQGGTRGYVKATW
ncbi:MAG: hypothetical protein SFV54_01435 [Bryobacteraceae bacterium]|nr:hypothetical protein [Bryobacteraceae bacterium]